MQSDTKNGLFGLGRFKRCLRQKRSRTERRRQRWQARRADGPPRRADGPPRQLPDSEQVLGGLSDRGKPCGERVPGTGAAFAHFCDQKASGDKEKTNGDKLSGLEFAGFSGQKTEFGARRTVFGGKRANLEAQAPLLTSDTKSELFGVGRFERFAPKTER